MRERCAQVVATSSGSPAAKRVNGAELYRIVVRSHGRRLLSGAVFSVMVAISLFFDAGYSSPRSISAYSESFMLTSWPGLVFGLHHPEDVYGECAVFLGVFPVLGKHLYVACP